MAYQVLQLSPDAPEPLRHLIRGSIERFFLNDVHWMLCAAEPSLGPKGHFQFSAAIVLLSVIGGLSRLFGEGQRDGDRYVSLIRDHYPWDLDPPTGIDPAAAASLLYTVFRNPLVHSFGIRNGQDRGAKVGRVLRANEQAEASVDAMENASSRAGQGSIRYHADRTVIWVDDFCWGIRKMIERLTADPALCSRAIEGQSTLSNLISAMPSWKNLGCYR